MGTQTITLDGKKYVVIPREEYERLSRAAKLPPLPEPDAEGNYPAVEYARALLARKLILRREALGLSQADLARRAGIRPETLNRIESGRVTPTVPSIEKVERALQEAGGKIESRKGKNRRR